MRAALDTIAMILYLEQLNTPGKLITIINIIYAKVNEQVHKNGERSEIAELRKEVKQGDSLSSLQFLITMDRILKIQDRIKDSKLLEF